MNQPRRVGGITRIATVAFWVFAGEAALAQQVTHVHPCALAAGKSQRVTVFGSQLADVRQLWTSFEGAARFVEAGSSDTQALFDVDVPATAELGVHGVRAVGAVGMSEIKLVLVDTLPVVLESGNNNPQAPQSIALPVAVSGFILPEETDFYSFEATAGMKLSIEVVGHRLGTGLDPFVRLVSPSGRELLTHDNDAGLEYDFRFTSTLPEAGVYRLEVRDARFQGGLWGYVLRLGDFPAVRVGYPAVAKPGELVAAPSQRATDVPPTSAEVRYVGPTSTVLFPGGNASSWVTVAQDDCLSQQELEPNNTREEANPSLWGRTIEGRLEVPGDVDAFRWPLQAQQPYSFRVQTRRLASPADIYLRLLDPAGNVVATSDDANDEDAQLAGTASAEGSYTLLVEDINQRGGVDFVYRIATGSPARDYALRLATDRVVIPQGTSVPVAVAVERMNVGEPVEIHAESSGVVCRPMTVPANAGSGVVVFESSDGKPRPSVVRVLAKTSGDSPIVRGGLLTSLLRPKLEQMVLVPPVLETALSAMVVDRPFFRLEVKPSAVGLIRFATSGIEVVARRDKFADEPIALTLENLPPNLAPTNPPIPKGARQVVVNVEAKGPAPAAGRYPIWVSGTSTFAGRSVRVFSEVVEVNLRPGVTLTFGVPEVTIGPSQKQMVQVRADRQAGVNGALALSWPNLPAGVQASAATIAEGQSEATVELAVAAAAAAGSTDGIVVRTTFAINGQQETVDSTPMRLVISPKP